MSMVSRLRSTIREVTHTFPSSKRIKNTYCAGPRFGATRRSDASSVYSGPGATRSLRSTHTEKSALARQRVIRMLLVVVIIFFCCWTPCYIWWLILMAADSFAVESNIWNTELNTALTVLTYISSCTNPITYCFLNKKFRMAMLAAFGRKTKGAHRFPRVYVPTTMHSKPMNRSVSTASQVINPSTMCSPKLRRSNSSLGPSPSNHSNLTSEYAELNGRARMNSAVACNGESVF